MRPDQAALRRARTAQAKTAAPAALRNAIAARAAALAALSRFTAQKPGSTAWTEASKAAGDAISTFVSLRYDAVDNNRTAELPEVDTVPGSALADIDHSQACGGRDTNAGPRPVADRVAVAIGDLDEEFGLNSVAVDFAFASGSVACDVSANGGWAFAKLRPGDPLRQVKLHRSDGPAEGTVMDAPLAAAAIVTVGVDAQALAGPPFATLVLTIEGESLLAPGPLGGRYTKH